MFVENNALVAIRFFERILTHTKGIYAKKPFELIEWQRQILWDVFGTCRSTGLRQYTTVYCEVPKKNGKQLALDTPVPTVNGWTTIGEIRPGDVLFDETGAQTRVLRTAPIDETERAFAFTFDDGEVVVAGERHLWSAESYLHKRRPRIYSTLEMFELFQRGEKERSPFRIRMAGSLECPERNLPIDPYVYGFWIGNGNAAKPELTVFRPDVEAVRRQIPYAIEWQRSQDGESDVLRIPALRKVSVSHFTEKRIDPRYLRSSIRQRWSLLAGLMDSDGCVANAGGQAIYGTVLPGVAEDVRELLRTLGIKSTTNIVCSDRYGKPNLPYYRILFTAFDDMPVSRLERKLANRKRRNGDTRSRYQYVRRISEVDKRPMRCIQVDSPSQLYLAGPGMVPTHNTELAAGIALFGLLMDDEPGAEVYIAAASRDQASIGFRVAAQMVRNSPRLNDMCRIIDSTKTITKKDDPNSFLRAISADAGTQDGINPHIAVFDELHRQRNSDLWDVLKYGMATRSQPLLFAITTAGITGESPICEQQHDYARAIRDGLFQDPSYYPVIYGLDEKEDWTNEGEPEKFEERKEPDPMNRRKFINRLVSVAAATGWYKANPSLGHHLQVEKIREEFLQAQNNPSQQNSFRRLRLNQWVGQEVRYIPMDHWKLCGEPFNVARLAGKPCFAGLDLSATQDITALVLAFPIDGDVFLVPHFWLPEHELHLRSRRDKVTYDLWAAQGLIHTTPGDQVDYGFIRKVANDLAKLYDIREIGYDRWNATQIIQNLTDDGLTMVPIGQGFASMSAPTKEMLRLILDHRLRHNGNPVLNWMADNFSVKQDPQDNVKPSKPDRRKTSKRIDGIQATVNAIARMIVAGEAVRSVYDSPEEIFA